MTTQTPENIRKIFNAAKELIADLKQNPLAGTERPDRVIMDRAFGKRNSCLKSLFERADSLAITDSKSLVEAGSWIGSDVSITYRHTIPTFTGNREQLPSIVINGAGNVDAHLLSAAGCIKNAAKEAYIDLIDPERRYPGAGLS